jgi:hypothetical protein
LRTSLDVVDRGVDWWNLPRPAQLLQLAHSREDLRRFNVYDTETPENGGAAAVAEPPAYRTYDGSQTYPDNPSMGKTGTRLGRNAPPEVTYPQEQSLFDPRPRDVSTQLLNRDSFKPATTLNVLAAAWLQFETHDWFSHGENSETEFLEVPLSAEDRRIRVEVPGELTTSGIRPSSRAPSGRSQRATAPRGRTTSNSCSPSKWATSHSPARSPTR